MSHPLVRKHHPTAWTPPLQIATVVCSLVFTVGTILQNFVIIDLDMLRLAMRSAGASASDAPGFLTGLRTVGCLYIVGNAAGLLALRGRTRTFWVVVAVNVTQAAGVFAIPPAVFDASVTLYGPAGILPSVITDGGAALLALALLGSLVVFRTPWAQRQEN
ncbi:hypothetical protein G3I59_02100 [Amycolatopsis rubida]|uniref:DUF4383 domain-containing protein n=1 Tax=Amycolatopsis rubida TaxID=112413 RepID=A0ABX0BNN0_9PSEU|nr:MULTISPECIES: hypothetical protein [Amycolatopsis]MYW89456.1 hypothetical protein [Amycolatopsis rubida]NEC54433.1 hypothetical protein [Amycolatopsis rubida]OAP20495.1 hypothetical protein A4R44_08791 [Amycolatopsis sp. M39]